MTARPVPLTATPSAAYAVMTPEPLETEDLIPPPSPELLRHYGTSDIALRRLRSRPHQMLLMRRASLTDVAFIQRDTRIEALRVAQEHDGVVVDLAIPRAIEQTPEEVSLAHATQWYVVDYSRLEAAELSTCGLISFGLPEILLVDISIEHHAMYSAVLSGLVHRLIVEWPENDPVGDATVTLRDIAYGLGDPAASQTPKNRSADLTITYQPDPERLLVRVLSDPATALFAP